MERQLHNSIKPKLERLVGWFDGKACVVAFSGGVDSTTLAKATLVAYERGLLKMPPTGYFAESFTSTEIEKKAARRIASEIGLPLVVVQSQEFDDPRFVANTSKRCYWCKKIRFSAVKEAAQREYGDPLGVEITLIDGSNASDHADYRPGQVAAQEVGVRSPLAELGLRKSEIREIAAYWGLSVAEKPSAPCLATRLAYNLPLSNSVLRQVEAAELIIKSFNASTCRARIDAPGAIRIEVPENEIEHFASPQTRKEIVSKLLDLGFNFISLDLEGFYSGKNNRSLKS